MADFRLPDAMDAPETLLQAIGVPRQVIVNHQVRALQVDAFTGGVRGKQDFRILVLREQGFRLFPVFAPHAAVDGHNGFRPAKE